MKAEVLIPKGWRRVKRGMTRSGDKELWLGDWNLLWIRVSYCCQGLTIRHYEFIIREEVSRVARKK